PGGVQRAARRVEPGAEGGDRAVGQERLRGGLQVVREGVGAGPAVGGGAVRHGRDARGAGARRRGGGAVQEGDPDQGRRDVPAPARRGGAADEAVPADRVLEAVSKPLPESWIISRG